MKFDGWCASLGVDPLELPAHRLPNLALHYLTKDGDAEGIQKWERGLWATLPFDSQPDWSPFGAQAMRDQWRSLKD